jgi:hypothetical protein
MHAVEGYGHLVRFVVHKPSSTSRSIPFHSRSFSTTINILTIPLPSCAALHYALPELARLSLRKQGLQSGIQVSTILSSARYAYAQTPDTDSKLRAHYLALIIRSRNTFKRSGTMQMEMEEGGRLFFDLFVAMCNHVVCLSPILSSDICLSGCAG